MKKFLRRLAKLAAALLVILLLVVAVAWWRSEQAMARHYDLPDLALAVDASPEAVARGEHLVRSRGCTGCHGEDLGGKHVVNAGPVMQIHAPNITRGGLLAQIDVARFEHAVRHAVDRDGRSLLVMPSEDYVLLPDTDIAAMYAYLQQLPAREGVQADSSVGPLGRVLMLFGKLPILAAEKVDHARASQPEAPPPAAVDAAYGAHVAQICVGCHRADFSGGHVAGTPARFKPAANLTPHAEGLGAWSEADFLTAMRTGVRPDGRALDLFMPWREFSRMDDTELRAMWVYLSSLPGKPTGK
jgi:mono/diheme cytochrome c family protein